MAQIDVVAPMDMVVDAAPGPLRPESGNILYRAVQEALTNIVRHARANQVKIRLGASLAIHSCPGGGTDVTITVGRIRKAKAADPPGN